MDNGINGMVETIQILEERVKSLEEEILKLKEMNTLAYMAGRKDAEEEVELLKKGNKYSLEEIIDAVQYGFNYMKDSQNDGISVPVGNTLQWLMSKDGLIHVPEEFKEYLKTNNL